MTFSNPTTLQIGARWFPEVRAGLERVYYDLVRHLPDAGFDVRGLVLATAPPSAGPGLDIKAYARPDAALAKRILALRRATQVELRSRAISLIACHYPLYGFPIIDVMGAVPTVFHFHGPWAAEGRIERNAWPAWLTKRCIEQILYRRPASFVVNSRAFRDVLIRTYRVPTDRITVIPCAVDLARFKNSLDKTESRRTLGLPTDRPVVLTIRRLVRRMGLENLIAAIADVARKVPEILLIVGGIGPLQAELQQLIEDRDLDKHVLLVGNVSDACLPLLYRAADISVVPSLALEGFGLTTIESLACGTPVLVTPVGGLPEAVGDLSQSLILGGCSPRMIADGLVGFYSRTLAVPDAGACASYVQQRFDWPVIARRVADLYRSILTYGHENAARQQHLRAGETAT